MNHDAVPTDAHPEDSSSSNTELINDIVSSLRELKDADNELTEILVANLLTISPTQDAVENAADAIEQLAVERAKESD